MNKTELTQEQKRIKIAEACGWINCEIIQYEGFSMKAIGYRSKSAIGFESLPDYFNDLNAMHEAIETLDDYQKVDFVEKLKQVTMAYSSTYRHVFEMLTSTATQRAESFGKTLGLW